MKEIIKKTRSKLRFTLSAPECMLKRDSSPKKSQRQQASLFTLYWLFSNSIDIVYT